MDAPIYIDISAFQPLTIDWGAYKKWCSQWDGISRVCIRSSYGTGYTDQHFQAYRNAALNVGIDQIIFYHYAYPNLNGPEAEANWQHQVVGAIRSHDLLMLDYEENVSQATADWAYRWLAQQEKNYAGKLPTIYASDAYVRARLQDSRLTRYPLTLANWQFISTARPPCPPPWSHYTYLQYTDRAINIPGIPGGVDANIYLGGNMTINPGSDPAFLNTYWNSGVQPAPDFTTGIAHAWAKDVSQDLWRGVPIMKEGKIMWKGVLVPWQQFGGGFYTWEKGQAFWHSNS